MASVSLPFSGSVTQAINPWNFFLRTMSEIGLININIGNTAAPDIEQDVLDKVGSYGRQIGRMADAMEVLVSTLDENNLSDKQKMAVFAFRQMLEDVRKIKAARRNVPIEPSLYEPRAKLAREAVAPALKVAS